MVQQPVYYPAEVQEIAPGTDIYFAVEVTNNSTVEARVRLTGRLHQGATMGTGDLIATYESDDVPINAGYTSTIYLPGSTAYHTTVDLGGDPERDLMIDLEYQDASGNWQTAISDQQFFRVYDVRPTEYDFTIGTPEVRMP